MGEKVTFESSIKTIIVNTAPVFDGTDWVVDIDIKIDVFSDGKEDWLADSILNKFKFPVVTAGGDDLPGSKKLGSTFFFEYGWKLRPYEANHVLRINGNIYSRDGSSPFAPTLGAYGIMIINTVSNLVDSTVQQLEEIEYASFNGGITYDDVGGIDGVAYPIGTAQEPSGNIYDSRTIAEERGFTTGFIVHDMEIPLYELDGFTPFEVFGFTFVGSGKDRTEVVIPDEALVYDCTYTNCHILGYLDGNNTLHDCLIDNLHYIKGYLDSCILAPGIITLGGSDTAHFLDCFSGVPGTGTPTIDMGGSGQPLALRNYNGGIKLINKSGPESVSIDLNSGQVKLDMTTVTNGTLVVRGIGKLIDADTGDHIHSGIYGSLIVMNELVNVPKIAKGVWAEDLSSHSVAGSTGEKLEALPLENEVAIEVWSTTTSGNQAPGTFGEAVTTVSGGSCIAEEIAQAVWSDSNATGLIADVSFIKNIEGGKWSIEGNQMIFYAGDNTTEIARFNLFDINGNPAVDNIYKRIRV